MFGSLAVETLPFVFPFRHDGGNIDYKISRCGEIVTLKVEPTQPEDGWPYIDYPVSFEPVLFDCSEPQAISEDDSLRLMHQFPWFNPDWDIVVVVPSKNADPSLPNNLWNVPDDEPCVQCVFILNTKSMEVAAFTDID